MYEACGLVNEPEAWSETSKATVEIRPPKVTFQEPNEREVEREILEVPSSWKEAASRVASGEATFVVLELCCEEGNHERWRACLKVHKLSWRRIRAVFKDCAGHERLLLSHEWPKGSGLLGETVYQTTAKSLGLSHEFVVDRSRIGVASKREVENPQTLVVCEL